MKVRYLDGPLKGQIVDMPFHVAAPLMREGYVRSLSDELSEKDFEGPPECAMRQPEAERQVKPRPTPRKK
jgi:hypothetical protein